MKTAQVYMYSIIETCTFDNSTENRIIRKYEKQYSIKTFNKICRLPDEME